MSTSMTIQLDQDVKLRLDRLADSTNQEWQIAEIQAAFGEAVTGEFASDDEVAAFAKKWKARAP